MKDDHSDNQSAPREQMLTWHSPERYCIQVQGSIDSSLSRYLEELTIRKISLSRSVSATEITVQVADQSMLARVLEQIFMRRLPLISVESLDATRDEEA